MKQTALKFIILSFNNIHLFLILVMFLFFRLLQVKQANGKLIFFNPQQPCNHFILVTIYLVLEEHEMICYWF